MALGEEIGLGNIMPNIGGGGGLSSLVGGDAMVTIMWLICLLLIVGIVGVLIYRHLQYKYLVVINEPRGNVLLRGKTEARKILERDGTTRWYLRSLKKKIHIPTLKVISPSMDKRLREGVIELLRVDAETFIAIDVGHEVNEQIKKYNIKIIPLANSLNNIRQITADAKRDYGQENWVKANMGTIVQVAGLMTIIGGMIMIVILMKDNATVISNGAGTLARASEQLTDAMIKFNSCQVAG